MGRAAIRARLLDFIADPTHSKSAARMVNDGLLLVEDGRIVGRGEFGPLSRALGAGDPVLDYSNCLLLPGFVDAHAHFPQIDTIASASTGLLDWLQRHTYPTEARYADPAVCAAAAHFFVDELVAQGTTTACVLGTVHPQSVEALFGEAHERSMRLVAGKCLMDRNCPPELQDQGDDGIRQSLELAERWHGLGRLSYAITPRFAGSSTERQLAGAAELARARPDLYVQSHLAESEAEVRWIAELYPQARSYLDIYDSLGLLRELSVWAHCVWIDDDDRRRFAQTGAVAAACPSANFFLGSGSFDFDRALQAGVSLALGTDVGAGQSLSMLATMRAAHNAAMLRGTVLRAAQLFYWATRGAADALGFNGRIGTLESGAEADFVILDPAATPLLARRSAQARSLEEQLFALMILGDDRAVRETFIAGQPLKAKRRVVIDPIPSDQSVRTRGLARRFMGRMQRMPRIDTTES